MPNLVLPAFVSRFACAITILAAIAGRCFLINAAIWYIGYSLLMIGTCLIITCWYLGSTEGRRWEILLTQSVVIGVGFVIIVNKGLGTSASTANASLVLFVIGAIGSFVAGGILIFLCDIFLESFRVLWHPGLCRACGYEMQASQSNTCPRCGLQVDHPVRPPSTTA